MGFNTLHPYINLGKIFDEIFCVVRASKASSSSSPLEGERTNSPCGRQLQAVSRGGSKN